MCILTSPRPVCFGKLKANRLEWHCKAQSIQLALLNRMKSGALPQLSTTEDLLDCVAREGVDSMAKEGGFVGCLERKEAA